MISGAVHLGVFAIIWFLALFCLLPVGMREDEESTVRLSTKFLIATAIAAVGWGIFYGLIHMGMIDI